METIAKIRRLYYVEHQGAKTIARTLKLSKNTVKKIIRGDHTVSRYDNKTQRHRVLGPYIESLSFRKKHPVVVGIDLNSIAC